MNRNYIILSTFLLISVIVSLFLIVELKNAKVNASEECEKRIATEIAIGPISYPVKVVEVKKLDCPGCFSVKLQRGEDNQHQFTIVLNYWAVWKTEE